MSFDLSQLGKVYEYVSNHTHIVLDVLFLSYSLYTIVTYYNLGITNALLRLIGYIASFFISRILTIKIAEYLKIVEPMNIILLALFLFFLFAYILYKQLQFFSAKSRSWLDSMLGGLYGAIEIILLLSIVDTCVTYADKYGFPVPEWIITAKQPTTKKSITQAMFWFVHKHTSVLIKEERVNQAATWVQKQLKIDQPIVPQPKATTAQKTK